MLKCRPALCGGTREARREKSSSQYWVVRGSICRQTTSACQTIHPALSRPPFAIISLPTLLQTSSSTTEQHSPLLVARFLVLYLDVVGPLKFASASGVADQTRQYTRSPRWEQSQTRPSSPSGRRRLAAPPAHRTVSNLRVAVITQELYPAASRSVFIIWTIYHYIVTFRCYELNQ